MDKIIITAGCSFTNGAGTWPYHIVQHKYGRIHNVADTGAGNSYISRSVIWEVNNQLKLGKNPKDIEVIIVNDGSSIKITKQIVKLIDLFLQVQYMYIVNLVVFIVSQNKLVKK